MIFDEIEYIAAHPLSGRDCSYLRSNYRCSKVKSHLIFYKYAENQKFIEVIRVLHQRMDIEERLQ